MRSFRWRWRKKMKLRIAVKRSDSSRSFNRNGAINIRAQQMLPSRLTGGRAAGFVDSGRFGGTVDKKLFALEELLRDGGNIAPRNELFWGDSVGSAKSAIGRNPRELASEESAREFIPCRLVNRSQQSFSPRSAAHRLGKIRECGHGHRGHANLTGKHEDMKYMK